jgi:hypothetical protein
MGGSIAVEAPLRRNSWHAKAPSPGCPLWVISGHSSVHQPMSALPLKADMSVEMDVRLVPLADSAARIMDLAEVRQPRQRSQRAYTWFREDLERLFGLLATRFKIISSRRLSAIWGRWLAG